MASKLVTRNGEITGVYDDRWRELIEAMPGGPITIRRATNVEYDEQTGDWVATLVDTGAVIARGRDRGEVIRQEVDYLEREVIR